MDLPYREPRSTDVKRLQSNHREIVRLAILGLKQRDIADQLGIGEVRVSQVLNSSIVRKMMNELHESRDQSFVDASQELHELLPDVMSAYKRVMQAPDEEVPLMTKVKLGSDILDRTGHGKITKVEKRSTRLTMTPDDVADINERSEAIRRERYAGKVLPFNPPAEAVNEQT